MTKYRFILGMKVNSILPSQAADKIINWAKQSQSRYICAANVHMTMESYDNSEYRNIINSADMVTPDGMPLVWMLRLLGEKEQQRIYGPDLTLWVCRKAAEESISIGLYGGEPNTLQMFKQNLETRFPGLNIACAISPPYRPLTVSEDEFYIKKINESGAKVLLVGLGCPKQERWMAEHKNKITAVMIGVGAAFDFHAGTVRQAPGWIQKFGMEWFFRLLMEPKRLWKRYLKHNPRFVLFALKQLINEY